MPRSRRALQKSAQPPSSGPTQVPVRVPDAAPAPEQDGACSDLKVQRAALHKQLVKTKFCVYFLKGQCQYGKDCAFAHTGGELRSSPDLRKTRLCPDFAEGGCTNPGCSFAHGEDELRSTDMFFKKSLCVWHEKGKCRNGEACRFAHGASELLHQQHARDATVHPSCDGDLLQQVMGVLENNWGGTAALSPAVVAQVAAGSVGNTGPGAAPHRMQPPGASQTRTAGFHSLHSAGLAAASLPSNVRGSADGNQGACGRGPSSRGGLGVMGGFAGEQTVVNGGHGLQVEGYPVPNNVAQPMKVLPVNGFVHEVPNTIPLQSAISSGSNAHPTHSLVGALQSASTNIRPAHATEDSQVETLRVLLQGLAQLGNTYQQTSRPLQSAPQPGGIMNSAKAALSSSSASEAADLQQDLARLSQAIRRLTLQCNQIQQQIAAQNAGRELTESTASGGGPASDAGSSGLPCDLELPWQRSSTQDTQFSSYSHDVFGSPQHPVRQ